MQVWVERMKIALDVDGIITDAPEFFSVWTKALIAAGHEIYVISDFDEYYRDQRVKELEEYGIEYTAFIITKRKKEYCLENGIEYAIDDIPHKYYRGSSWTPLSIIDIKKEV